MTTRVIVVNEPENLHAIEFRENNPAAVGYEPPFQELRSGEHGVAHVHAGAQLEVREGRQLSDAELAGAAELPPAASTAPCIEVADEEIATINGIRFQGVAFKFMAEDANVGKSFRLISNTDGIVTVQELPEFTPQAPHPPADQLPGRSPVETAGNETAPPPGDPNPGDFESRAPVDDPNLETGADAQGASNALAGSEQPANGGEQMQ